MGVRRPSRTLASMPNARAEAAIGHDALGGASKGAEHRRQSLLRFQPMMALASDKCPTQQGHTTTAPSDSEDPLRFLQSH